MKTSEQIDLISKAVALAQGEMSPASKSTVNPFFKSTYSNLTQVWDAIREPLSKNNISVFQDVISTPVGIAVLTRVCHASGQWMEFGPLEITLVKKDAQSLGSATSYAKRYALCAAIGVVADEDDDGEKAMGRNNSKEPVKQSPNTNQEKEDPIRDERLLLEFHKSYTDEDYQMIKLYIQKYASYWKKSIGQSIQDYIDNPKQFESDLKKWKKPKSEDSSKVETRNVA